VVAEPAGRHLRELGVDVDRRGGGGKDGGGRALGHDGA
jgi:hypothetical protein